MSNSNPKAIIETGSSPGISFTPGIPALRLRSISIPWRVPILLATAFLAYSDLVSHAASQLASDPISTLLFIPGYDTIAVSIASAAWVVWLRRKTFSSSMTASTPILSICLWGAAIATFSYSRHSEAPDLLLASAAALLLAVASTTAGVPGIRRMGLAAFLLVWAIPLPAALESEVVWFLQKTTTRVLGGVLAVFQTDWGHSGTVLIGSTMHFEIIESCSGLRLIQVLIPMAIGIAAYRRLDRQRFILFFAFALVFGYSLNLVRILFVLVAAGYVDPIRFADHTSAAYALLALGTIGLYLVATWIGSHRDASDDTETIDSQDDRGRLSKRRDRIIVTMSLVFVAVVIWDEPPAEKRVAGHRPIEFPKSIENWQGTGIPRNYVFPYSVSPATILNRSFVHVPKLRRNSATSVEFFVSRESPGALGPNRLPESKIPLPGPSWRIVPGSIAERSLVGIPVTIAEVEGPGRRDRALAYYWRVRDRGLLTESVRETLGVKRLTSNRDAPRTVIRILTELRSGRPSDRRRSEKALTQFIRDAGPYLSTL